MAGEEKEFTVTMKLVLCPLGDERPCITNRCGWWNHRECSIVTIAKFKRRKAEG